MSDPPSLAPHDSGATSTPPPLVPDGKVQGSPTKRLGRSYRYEPTGTSLPAGTDVGIGQRGERKPSSENSSKGYMLLSSSTLEPLEKVSSSVLPRSHRQAMHSRSQTTLEPVESLISLITSLRYEEPGSLSAEQGFKVVLEKLTELTPEQSLEVLQFACHTNHLPLAKAIIMKVGFDARDRDGNNALHLVCLKGSRQIIHFALKQIQESGGFFAGLENFFLGRSGRFDRYSRLDELRASPLGVANKSGFYPLQLGHKNPKIPNFYRSLKVAGIRYPTVPEEVTQSVRPDMLFHKAIEEGDSLAVTRLLMLGANVEAVNDNDGMTPLMWACNAGKIDVVNALLAAGANIEATNKYYGSTSLMWACQLGRVDVVNTLLAAGASIEAIDELGMTPLIRVCKSGNIEVVRRLLASRPNVSTLDSAGYTAYIHALMNPAFDGTDIRDLLQTLDDGTSNEIMSCKELAHRFSVKGARISLQGRVMQLEGWDHSAAQLVQLIHLRNFYPTLIRDSKPWLDIISGLRAPTKALVAELEPAKLTTVLSQTIKAFEGCLCSPFKAQRRLLEGDTVGLLSSLGPTHIVAVVYKPLEDGTWEVALINKGRNHNGKPGIRIFKTNQFPLATLEIFVSITKSDFFNTEIVSKLALTDEVYIPLKKQRSGNCSVASSNGMEIALLYLQFRPLFGGNHEAALEFAMAIKKARCQTGRLGTLKTYLDCHDQPGSIPPNLSLLHIIVSQMRQKQRNHPLTEEDQQVLTLLEEWLDRPPPGTSAAASSSGIPSY